MDLIDIESFFNIGTSNDENGIVGFFETSNRSPRSPAVSFLTKQDETRSHYKDELEAVCNRKSSAPKVLAPFFGDGKRNLLGWFNRAAENFAIAIKSCLL
jgi:hypothetical protein